MKPAFNPAQTIETELLRLASQTEGFDDTFAPDVRPADPRFGDFQANGVLPFAKKKGLQPRQLGTALLEAARNSGVFDPEHVDIELAGPGFLNFQLKGPFLWQWLGAFITAGDFRKGARNIRGGRTVVLDYPSANTAKQPHIGHLRPMVIGESVARLLDFCGAQTIRDNHIGDWGTNFGTLIMMIKRRPLDWDAPAGETLAALDRLYKKGTALEKENPEMRDVSRNELVQLQNGDPENTRIWRNIVDLSKLAFDRIFEQLGVRVDYHLGESFYRDKVDRVYRELAELGIAEESEGALVVWHDEVPKFSRHSDRPYPFNIRKKDGASNYASTDLATALYRVETFGADEIIYLTDARQQDHFQQLFLTVEKWFPRKGRPLPLLHHIWWGTILGPDKKPLKTKSGETVKLQDLLDEARQRALAVVTEKNPGLSEKERGEIAEAVGIGALKYADLSSNRTQDYVFSWERLLSFEGNTAPYLLYAVARINSIFRKTGTDPETPFDEATPLETESELHLARKLVGFVNAIELTLNDFRPHFLCTYLYELAGVYSTFYKNDRVLVDEPGTRARRLLLCARTRTVLNTGLELLGITPLERM